MNTPTKEWLTQKYWVEHKSIMDIARLCGYKNHHYQVQRWLQRYEIPRRPAHPYSGKFNKCWKGGKFTNKRNGYVYVRKGSGRNGKYIPEHQIISSAKKGEEAHHLNGIRNDNRPENLYLCKSSNEHQRFESMVSLFAKQLLWGEKPNKQLIKQFILYCKEHGYNISM